VGLRCFAGVWGSSAAAGGAGLLPELLPCDPGGMCRCVGV
jgi:hypothetical protein